MATSRQSRNLLSSLVTDGSQCDDPATIKREALKFFVTLFTDDWKVRPSLDGSFSTIGSDVVASTIENEFSELEIWMAIKECDGNKAPGPNDFNMT